ncbi:MAG: hypothetical protein M1522_03090 [Actinobacteria bacterium]|nr:hypothetical protein [Actinomycetota bacterium]
MTTYEDYTPLYPEVRSITGAVSCPRQCVANFDNILPLPKDVLVQRVGRLAPSDLRRVCAAARFAIQC